MDTKTWLTSPLKSCKNVATLTLNTPCPGYTLKTPDPQNQERGDLSKTGRRVSKFLTEPKIQFYLK
jgi:hypothetical protein